ncbi:MAG: VgrG-related protein [Ornithinimicrobium sp.]
MPISSTFLIEIDGTAITPEIETLLESVIVDDSQRLPDMFTLRFRDAGRQVLSQLQAKIGSTVKISVLTSEEQTSALLIEGEVTALEADFDAGGTFTLVRGYDPAHRLFRGRRTASYTQVTASDIVTTVAQRAGLATGTIQATSTVFDHVSQAGTTDWEFLESLAREVGHDLSVREGRLDFGAPSQAGQAPSPSSNGARTPLVLHRGTDLLRLRAVLTSSQQVKEVEVRGWDVTSKQALTASQSATTARVELPESSPGAMAAAFGNPTYVSTDVPYGTQAEVSAAAASLAEEVAGSFAELEGVARGNPAIRADAAISVDDMGAPFDGKYTVTSSRHRFEPATGYTTLFTVSGSADRSLLGLTRTGPTRRGLPGVVVAIVTDVSDPQNQGRVRLSLPWLSDDFVSDWSRTLQLGAGKDRGMMMLPEVGDEVLVAFEQGDFRRPYVLGGLHNGVDVPSAAGVALLDSGTGAVNRRSWVSRQGHRIDLLDQNGAAEGIAMSTADGALALSLDGTETKVTLHSDGTVLIEGSQGIVVDAATSPLDLKGSQINLTASQGVSVDGGGGNVSVTAGAQLELSGTTAKLEGSANTEVKGGAMCSVSAAMVRIN